MNLGRLPTANGRKYASSMLKTKSYYLFFLFSFSSFNFYRNADDNVLLEC
jgi:hypothetical protein